jgi:hypothetical protein
MKPISTLIAIVGMGLASATPAAGSPASEAARVALTEKADLPSLRPVLPNLLGDRDDAERGDGLQGPSREAQREAEKNAGSAAAGAHAAAAARKEAREAARAAADQLSASEKANSDKVKKDKKDKKDKPQKPDKKDR